MASGGKTFLVCDCEGTMPLDGRALGKACRTACSLEIHTQLCRRQIGSFKDALQNGQPLVVACTQEAPLFAGLAGEMVQEPGISFVNIREHAGWSAAGHDALPKVAALLAQAGEEVVPPQSVTMRSAGTCLVYGQDEVAIEAARQLAGRLEVTLLLVRPSDLLPPQVMTFPVFKGTVAAARGHLGTFELTVDDYAPAIVSSRAAFCFDVPREGVTLHCDLILDLTDGEPLFPAPGKRDGYFRIEPQHAAAVQRALFDLVDLVGEFDKPRYVNFDGSLCAHSRNHKTGCTRCLDVCPAFAIRPDGDAVTIDPYVCGGCGACHSVCPTGAASYALPPAPDLLARLRTLLTTFAEAGGQQPVVFVHDNRHGEEMIGLLARCGHGLPAHVLPFGVNEVTQIGFDFLSTALSYGASRILLLVPPARADELDGLKIPVALAEALMSGLGFGTGRVQILLEGNPEAIEHELYAMPMLDPPRPSAHLPMGSKRDLIAPALGHLHRVAPAPVDVLPLPPSAPFGRVTVDVDGCTLCLACVGVCPTGALLDNPEKPRLSFLEKACIQCRLCESTCPEEVIKLEPRFNFAPSARSAIVLKEEEPFHCIRCGKPFGTRSTIERIIGRLAENHWMFQDKAAIDRIRMCDDCRVIHQFELTGNPFAGPPRPITRTTDDYLREREIEEARAASGSNGAD